MRVKRNGIAGLRRAEQQRLHRREIVPCAQQPFRERVRLPALLLQPIVENAIKYGVAATREKVVLRIAATADGPGRLVLTVTNHREGKRAASALATPSHGTGVGIANVCARLLARFGDAASCTYGPLGDAAYEVRLSMPFEPAALPEALTDA